MVLSDKGSAPTLVFDEIDTGVGGAVADAIGARLARLAGKVQVMAVTHAPQVVARAGPASALISKDALDKGKRVATRVNTLAEDHRREEIARMLAGAEITAEGAAARRSGCSRARPICNRHSGARRACERTPESHNVQRAPSHTRCASCLSSTCSPSEEERRS